MAVVAVAIVLSFHLKSQPSPLELRMARPLGIIFWLLSILTLFVGVANYISTSMRAWQSNAKRRTEADSPRNGQQIQPSAGYRPIRLEDPICTFLRTLRPLFCIFSSDSLANLLSRRLWAPWPLLFFARV